MKIAHKHLPQGLITEAQLQASGNNVNTSGGLLFIAPEDISTITGMSPNTVIPPVRIADCKALYKRYPVAEVPQQAFIGHIAALASLEAIVASTKYTIQIFESEGKEGRRKQPLKFSYTAAATLSGTPSTDRYNVFYALASKINAYAGLKMTAYPIYAIAVTGASTLPSIGATVYSGSDWTATYVGAYYPSGTYASDANAILYVINPSGTFPTGSDTIDKGSLGGTAISGAATLTLTPGAGLYLIDDAGYSQRFDDSYIGPHAIKTIAGFTNFEKLDASGTGFVAGLAGVVGFGVGNQLIANQPTFTWDKRDTVEGDARELIYPDPEAGESYSCMTLLVAQPSYRQIDGAKEERLVEYTVWINNHTSSTPVYGSHGTNAAALIAAVATATKLTAQTAD